MASEETDAARRRIRLGVGAGLTLVIGGFVLVVASGMLRGAAGTEPVPIVSPSAAASGAAVREAAVYVHVSGAVRSPGLYVLASGSRVVDAVGAAGGFADDAESSALNLARALTDGEQVRVPRVGEAAPAPGSGAGGAATDGIVDLNTADLAALDTLPRIGPAIAQRIVEWREANGPFTSVDDLLAVPGIGEKMVEALRDRVRV